MRTTKEIGEDIVKESKKYKGLSAGSVAFRNVSRKLQCLDIELLKRLNEK